MSVNCYVWSTLCYDMSLRLEFHKTICPEGHEMPCVLGIISAIIGIYYLRPRSLGRRIPGLIVSLSSLNAPRPDVQH